MQAFWVLLCMLECLLLLICNMPRHLLVHICKEIRQRWFLNLLCSCQRLYSLRGAQKSRSEFSCILHLLHSLVLHLQLLSRCPVEILVLCCMHALCCE